MKKAIAYYRLSKERKGASGFGLDAQKLAVQVFSKANDVEIVDEFVEIESGKKSKRPKLTKALKACKKTRSMLLIARLDRLARNVAFIAKLIEAKVDFKAVDKPNAEKFSLHINAAFAERERDLISQRTKDALQIAKQRGIELGKYGRYVLSVVNKENANRFAESLLPLMKELRSKGIITVRAIARELNKRKIPTYRKKGRWHVSTVYNAIKRMKLQQRSLRTE